MPVGGLAFLTKESNNVRRAVEWTLATSVVRSGHITADDLPPLFLGLQLFVDLITLNELAFDLRLDDLTTLLVPPCGMT
jgi:hypothetical protein